MALIVGVHGIAQQLKAAEVLDDEWRPSLCGGVSNARRTIPDASFKSASYGNLFRAPARTLAAEDFGYRPSSSNPGSRRNCFKSGGPASSPVGWFHPTPPRCAAAPCRPSRPPSGR